MFDDWHAGGYEADEKWRAYETSRGRNYPEALQGEAAKNTFEFDLKHINESDIAVMLLPAGKSGHLEFGYMLGQGKPGFILYDGEPERWDVMYRFSNGVFFERDELFKVISQNMALQ